jgi:OFA family oxalate/formate antiporter-like MFS transporter
LSFILAGRIQDARGPRICAVIGATLVGLGFILSSFTTSLIYLYVVFGFIVGLGNGFGYATPIPVGSKWFPDKRGLVVGLMVAGYGAGSAIVIPVAQQLFDVVGWRMTFRILGVVLFLMCMLGASLLRNPPAGYKPEGWTPAPAPERSERDIPTKEMLGLPAFYYLWLAYCLGTTAGLMTISQLVPFANSVGVAAAVAGLFGAAGSASGRILSGWMSDLVGRLTTLRVMIFVSALAMPAFFILGSEQAILFYLLFAVVYWCFGAQLSVFATTTADFFGTRYLGLNYGLLFTAYGVAGIIGPLIASRVYSATGSYANAFYIAAGLALIALISISMARPPSREAPA